MRKLSEEERYILDGIQYESRMFWFRLASWDIFRPKKRDRFLNNMEAGMNIRAALKHNPTKP